MAEQQQWDDDSLTYCNRQAQKYSLDEKADDYCGAASLERGVHIFAFLSTIVAFLWLSSLWALFRITFLHSRQKKL